MAPQKPIALITGANTGIGLEVATQLARNHSYHVIIGSRNASAGETVAKDLEAQGFSASSVHLDLVSDESIAAAVNTVEKDFGVLDVLINNAGILIDLIAAKNKQPTRDLFNETFSTNVVGAACVTESLLPLLQKAEVPRIIFVTSRMGSLETAKDKTTPMYNTDYKAYDASKAAVNMLALNYARILEPTGGMVNAVCPGLVKTKLTNYTDYGHSVEVGAKRIVEVATSGKGGETATFSDKDGVIPW